MTTNAQQIRDLLAQNRPLVLGGVYDGLSARLADRAGFEVLFMGGFSVTATMLGEPDFGYLTQTEIADTARRVCRLTERPVLVDADTGYDPAHFNDRLVLGLKGTMSEAELHVLRARLRGGILNKARRGELRCRLPVGLVYDAAGHVVFDPDPQVQETGRLLFATFARTGTACTCTTTPGAAARPSPPTYASAGADSSAIRCARVFWAPRSIPPSARS